MGKTRLQWLIEETSREFQNKNIDNLERLAVMMSTNQLTDKCYKEILNRKDFSKNCSTLLSKVSLAGPIKFDVDEMRELLASNASLETINNRIMERTDEFFYELSPKDLEGDSFLRSMMLADMEYAGKVELEMFRPKECLDDMLNEEIPQKFDKAQLEVINKITNSIDEYAEKYAEDTIADNEGYKEESKEKLVKLFSETAYKELADNVVFSSDYTPDQIRTMSRILFEELRTTDPENLGSRNTSSWIKLFCDTIKEHDMVKYLCDTMVSNRTYFKLITEDGSVNELWFNFKKNAVDMISTDPYQSIVDGTFDDKVLTFSERFGLSPEEREYTLEALKSDLEAHSSNEDVGSSRFSTFFDLVIEGMKPQDIFECLNCIDDSVFRDTASLYSLKNLSSFGLPTDIIKECVKGGVDGLQEVEIRMAFMNGLSNSEIKSMIGKSAVEMCQIRVEIEQDRELHPNEHEVTKRIRRNNEIKEEAIENLPKRESDVNKAEHKSNDTSIDD